MKNGEMSFDNFFHSTVYVINCVMSDGGGGGGGGGGLSTGIIAGVVVTVVVVISLIIAAVTLWIYRAKHNFPAPIQAGTPGGQIHDYENPFSSPTVEVKMQQSAAYGQVSSGKENFDSETRMKESRAYISVTNQETVGISLYDSVL